MKRYRAAMLVMLGCLFLLRPQPAWAWPWQYACKDVTARGYINVLTLNLLYADPSTREQRLAKIADFAAKESAQGNAIDVFLLQEVVGGALAGTMDSSADLERLLAQRGLWYNRATRFSNGADDAGALLREGNAVLSRCRIAFTLSLELPPVEENPFPDFQLPVGRNVMMSYILVPGTGFIDVYNTHLCSFCSAADRSLQLQTVLDFAGKAQQFFPWNQGRIILGGDFNIDLNTTGGPGTYNQIIQFGLQDAYSTTNACGSCCSATEGYAGCSYGVFGNPYAVAPARIDYIFTGGLQPVGGEVVFNQDPDWVSDHSGVLVRLALPLHATCTAPKQFIPRAGTLKHESPAVRARRSLLRRLAAPAGERKLRALPPAPD